jgi:hypothetical protein
MRLPLLFPALVHGLRSTHNPTCRFFRKRSAYTICEPEMVLTPKLGVAMVTKIQSQDAQCRQHP